MAQEIAAKEENLSAMTQGIDTFVKEYRDTVCELKRILGVQDPRQTQGKAETSYEELNEKLQLAYTAIENFEAESAAEILRPLASLGFADEKVSQSLREIVKALDDFDSYSAEKLLDSLIHGKKEE